MSTEKSPQINLFTNYTKNCPLPDGFNTATRHVTDQMSHDGTIQDISIEHLNFEVPWTNKRLMTLQPSVSPFWTG